MNEYRSGQMDGWKEGREGGRKGGRKDERNCLVKEGHGNEKTKSNCFQVTKPSTCES